MRYESLLYDLLLVDDAKKYLKSDSQLEKLKTEICNYLSNREEYKKYDGFKDFFDNNLKLDSNFLSSGKFQVKGINLYVFLLIIFSTGRCMFIWNRFLKYVN